MALNNISLLALRLLLDSPEYNGDLVALLQKKQSSITREQAQAAGEELNRLGYLEMYALTRLYADAQLNRRGVDYARSLKGVK